MEAKGSVWGPKSSGAENERLRDWFLLYVGMFGGAERLLVKKRREGIECAVAQRKGHVLDEEQGVV